jgi:hypothetical protein
MAACSCFAYRCARASLAAAHSTLLHAPRTFLAYALFCRIASIISEHAFGVSSLWLAPAVSVGWRPGETKRGGVARRSGVMKAIMWRRRNNAKAYLHRAGVKSSGAAESSKMAQKASSSAAAAAAGVALWQWRRRGGNGNRLFGQCLNLRNGCGNMAGENQPESYFESERRSAWLVVSSPAS